MKNIDITRYLIPLLSNCFCKQDFCNSSEFEGVYFHNANRCYDSNKYGVPYRAYIIFNKTLQEESLLERYARYVKDNEFIDVYQTKVNNKDCVVYEFNTVNALFYNYLKETLTYAVDNDVRQVVENFWGITLPNAEQRLLIATVYNEELYTLF